MPQKLRSLLLILALAATCLLSSLPACAKPQVVLLLANRLTLSDIFDSRHPAIARMATRGNVGLVSLNSGVGRSVDGAYLSMGAGSGVASSPTAGEAYNASEASDEGTAGTVYHRRTGWRGAPGSVVNVGLSHLQAPAPRTSSSAGALGETLRKAGKKVAVLGNCDTNDEALRYGVAVAMDAHGLVPSGDVSSAVLADSPDSPTGKATNISLLLRLVKKSGADLIVIDFGDTERLEEMRASISDAAYVRYRSAALKRLDDLLAGLTGGSATDSAIILASALPPTVDGMVSSLAPVVWYSASRSGGGLLSSATTHTPGLIGVTDIAPSILSALGAGAPASMFGRPIAWGLTGPVPQAWLERIDAKARLNSSAEWPVLVALAVLIVIVLTGLSVIVVTGWAAPQWLRKLLTVLASALMAAPLAMVFGTIYSGDSLAAYGAVLVCCDVVILAVGAAAAYLLDRGTPPRPSPTGRGRIPGARLVPTLPGVIAFATAVALVFDVFSGLDLTNYTVAGAGQLRGIRFYGIGNEYMGVLIGDTLVAALWFRQKIASPSMGFTARVLFAVGLCAVLLAIGLPEYGTNAGGAITAVVAFGLCYRAMTGGRLAAKHVLFLFLISGIMIAVLAALDLRMRGGLGSHFGQAAGAMNDNGWPYIWSVITRKVGFNLQIATTRQGQTTMMAFVPFALIWFVGIQRRVRSRFASRPDIAGGFVAAAIGAVVAFLFNDSGIVAASLLLGMPIATLLCSLVGTSLETAIE